VKKARQELSSFKPLLRMKLCRLHLDPNFRMADCEHSRSALICPMRPRMLAAAPFIQRPAYRKGWENILKA
jgi:hypothetical protein